MQRRAAAVSAVVFLLVAAGAYVFIGAAEEPTISMEGDHTLGPGGSFTGTDGTTYNVSSLSEGSATFSWTVSSSEYTLSWQNGSTVTYQNVSFDVVIPNASDPGQFTLRRNFSVSDVLAADPAVENETITRADGNEYVVYVENGTTELLSEYLPERRTVTLDEGQTFDFRGNQTTVSNVSASSATLTWTAPRTLSRDASEGGNVTLDTTYVAHFPSGSEVVLSTDFAAYQEEVERVNYFHERVSGLWAVSIMSGVTAVMLLGLAYMPSRY